MNFIVALFLLLGLYLPQATRGEGGRITRPIVYDWKTAYSNEPQVIVNILDNQVLRILENDGFSFSEMLEGKKGSRTDELFSSNPFYKNFVNVIGQQIPHDPKSDQLPAAISSDLGDIPEMVRLIRNFEDKGKRSDKDLKGGFYIRELSNNSQYPYQIESDGDEPRHFDERWLNSKFGYMKLIAVVNRIDRIDFNPDSCGEVRFVYRLSYHSPKSSSSLPLFVNIVRQYPKQNDCSEFAQKWLISPAESEALRKAGKDGAKKFADYLKNGAFKNLSFRQLELNFQSLRFTSGYMHDFGGQAMYMQRIFRIQNGSLQPIALENTPDVLAVEKDPTLLKKFVEYLKTANNLQKLDQGILKIDFDDRFLTKLSVSWSTLGRARTANKPYSKLFKDKQHLLKSINLSGLKFIKTHDALVERLNNLTCMGCHQSSGTAGFHMLGYADDEFSHGFNRQQLPVSPHAFAESSRRVAYVQAVANKAKPNLFRPHSNFPDAVWSREADAPKFQSATVGQICLADKEAFSITPSCEPAAECRKTVTTKDKKVLFGECVMKSSAGSIAGEACWEGEITENLELPKDRGPIPSYNLFSFQDKLKLRGAIHKDGDSKNYKCVLPQSGAPLGRSSRPCSAEEENFKPIENGKIPAELCANQGGNGFDLCAASGDSGACLESRVVRAMLDTCYPGHFCREDYICQKFPDYHKISSADYLKKKDGKKVNQSSPDKIHGDLIEAIRSQEIGFCVPTYFLFNMRLDGHPSPVTGLPPGEPKFDRSKPLRGYK